MDQAASIESNMIREDDDVLAHHSTPEQFMEILVDDDNAKEEKSTGRFCTAEELLGIIDQAIEDSYKD